MIFPWTLLTVFLAVNGLNAQLRTCFMDDGEPGQCVMEKDCPSSESDNICGYFGNEVAVCCSKSAVSPNSNLARKQRSPVNSTKKQIRQDSSCTFDNGTTGKCVKEEDCSASESGNICGFFGDAVAVCCPVKSSQKELKENESASSIRTIWAAGGSKKH